MTDEEKRRVDELQAKGLDADGIALESGVNKIAVSMYLRKKTEREQKAAGREKPAKPEKPEKQGGKDTVLEILRGVVEILLRYTER